MLIASAVPEPPERRPSAFGSLLPMLALTALAMALLVLRLPASYRFAFFAFEDPGADLAMQTLVARGDRPGIDDAYLYGLLPILFGMGWYGLLGLIPAAFHAALATAYVLTAWGLARFARAVGAGPAGFALLVVALPAILPVSYTSLVFMGESVLLVHALAFHAEGRRPTALALATACLFVKPSMAYLYGFILVVNSLGSLVGSRARTPAAWLRPFLPAGLVGLALAAVLGVVFGPETLLHSLDPSAGAAVYRSNNMGFFASGRAFWLPDRPTPGYYLGTIAGLWVAATLALVGSAAYAAVRPRRDDAADPAAVVGGLEVTLACAVMHVMFILFFFGNAWSWGYYFYMLILGLIAVPHRARSRPRAVGLGVLCVIGLLAEGNTTIKDAIATRSGYKRGPETAGLWAEPKLHADWVAARRAVDGRKLALLTQAEGLPLFVAGFEPPAIWYLARDQVRPAEMSRKLAQLAKAEQVLEVSPDGSRWFSEIFPEFAGPLADFDRTYDGPFFRVHTRRHSPTP